MRVNRSIPPATVIPVLTYPEVRAAVAWLSEAFGFIERTRIGESHRAQLAVGDGGAVIVAEGQGESSSVAGGLTHVIKVRVPDVATAFARARAHGARVIEEPTEHVYGERECCVEDPAGHRWQFDETVRDVAPEEYGCWTITRWPEYE